MSSSTRSGLLLLACVIVWGAFWQLAPAQIEGAKTVPKWEYRLEPARRDADFNKFGADGWEIAAVMPGSDSSLPIAVFKRPK